MTYKIFYTKTAISDIKKLDIVARQKIKKKIEYYTITPLHFAKSLTNSSIGQYRWRIGDYRIVFDILGNKIIILRIGHRREIYK